MQIQNIPTWAHVGCIVGLPAFALGRGGPLERFVAVLLLWEFLNGRLRIVPQIIFVPSDLIILVLSLGVCLRGRSYWTVWFSAAYLLSLVTDLVYLNSDMHRWTYLSAERVWTYVGDGALLWGALTWKPMPQVVGPAPRP